MSPARWIWQSLGLRRLTYELSTLQASLSHAHEALGRLKGKAEAVGATDLVRIERDIWACSAVATAAIEGEVLNLDAVRSSVAGRLGLDATPGTVVPRTVDALIDVMNAAAGQWNEPLTAKSLITWQAAICAPDSTDAFGVEIHQFRSHPVEVVSGFEGRKTVHFEGPPAESVPEEMTVFLAWFNDGAMAAGLDGLIRAGIAHLWFESIHPFSDGNGRIGRAILDRAIAQHLHSASRLHGTSIQILADKQRYYDALNHAQRGTGDVTPWLAWFIGTFGKSCITSLHLIDEAIARARFWTEHKNVALNPRQRKALTRMLATGAGKFLGGMTPKKYVALTRANNRLTASRDLSDLVEKNILTREGAGRSTYYNLAMPGWGWQPTPAARPRSAPASP